MAAPVGGRGAVVAVRGAAAVGVRWLLRRAARSPRRHRAAAVLRARAGRGTRALRRAYLHPQPGTEADPLRGRLEHRDTWREPQRTARHHRDQRLHRRGHERPAPLSGGGAVLPGGYGTHSRDAARGNPARRAGGLRHPASAAVFPPGCERTTGDGLARHVRGSARGAGGAAPLPRRARDLSAAQGPGFRIPLGRARGHDARSSATPARARAGSARRPRLQWARSRHGNRDGAPAGTARPGNPRGGAGLSGHAAAADAIPRPERHRGTGDDPVSEAGGRAGPRARQSLSLTETGMHATKIGLLTVLVLVNIAFVIGWIWAARRYRLRERPGPADIAIGVVTDFLDTLGIGSYAPTTALFKFRGKPADELIPGTLNVGHNASAFLETVLFVTTVSVEPLLLACMVASATAGAWLGAGVVSRLPRRTIQLFMGVALLVAAFFFLLKNLGAFPPGGTAFALAGWRFALAVAVSFVLGALMCIGIGNYGPIVIMLSLLGMHPLAAFPIMMASDGILQPVASLGFFRSGRFAHGPSLGLIIGGVVGVLISFYIVKQLPLTAMRWLVIVVVSYAAGAMLRSARATSRAAPAAAGECHPRIYLRHR